MNVLHTLAISESKLESGSVGEVNERVSIDSQLANRSPASMSD